MKRFRVTWRGYHRWVGLVLSVVLLVFCLSGILLNHREAIAGCDVGRSWLPEDYHITDYNNGIIRGTVAVNGDSVMAYGCAGVFLTDRNFASFKELNDGLPNGVDRRNIKGMIVAGDGTPWCVANYGVYRYDGARWRDVGLPPDGSRFSDITLSPDSAGVVVVSRSSVYEIGKSGEIVKHELRGVPGQVPEVSLFKTVWMLHSGELFGLPGRLVVDAIALVLTVLCVTAVLLFFLPGVVRRAARKSNMSKVKLLGANLRFNHKLHLKLGIWLLPLLLIITLTGTCLRPPLMIPFVLVKTSPMPGSALDNDNPWHDKLRAARWDAGVGKWLISTSEGFVSVDREFSEAPAVVESAPAVSPMGINVFEPLGGGEWLVGSFSGAYRWHPADGKVTDWFTGENSVKKGGRPVSAHLVSGYTADYAGSGEPLLLFYDKGCPVLPPMPTVLSNQPISLWNMALELHVGRCYTPLLGPFSSLFVFLSGTLVTLVLVSGAIVHFRRKIK